MEEPDQVIERADEPAAGVRVHPHQVVHLQEAFLRALHLRAVQNETLLKCIVISIERLNPERSQRSEWVFNALLESHRKGNEPERGNIVTL